MVSGFYKFVVALAPGLVPKTTPQNKTNHHQQQRKQLQTHIKATNSQNKQKYKKKDKRRKRKQKNVEKEKRRKGKKKKRKKEELKSIKSSHLMQCRSWLNALQQSPQTIVGCPLL